MRVLQLSGEFPPDRIGGVATYLDNVTSRASFETAVLVSSGDNYEDDPGQTSAAVRVERIDLGPAVAELGELPTVTPHWLDRHVPEVGLLAEAWDAVHVHDWYGVLPALAYTSRHRVPMVMTAHLPLRRGFSYANHPLPRVDKARLEALGFRNAARVFAPSESVRQVLLAEYDLDPTQVHVLNNGVDTALFTPNPGAETAHPSLLLVSRLTEQKGLDAALRAFAQLLAQHPSARLTIAGSGPLRAWLERELARRGLDGTVTLAGWVPHRSLWKLYASCWVFLAPSAYEPFGLTSLEAMSAGKVVVASRFGGTAEFIQDGVTGRLCTPQDTPALVHTLDELLSEPHSRRRLGQAARRQAEGRDWSTVVAALDSHYAQVTRS